MAAEVPVDDDVSTQLNQDLLAQLHTADRVFICGEAKSHCVNYTMRDIAEHWNKDHASLVLLEDCASAVPGFEAAAQQFVADMQSKGCTVQNVAEVKL